MRAPDRFTDIIEGIMERLVAKKVLKEDRPDYPAHYNTAYSAVFEVLDKYLPGEASPAALPIMKDRASAEGVAPSIKTKLVPTAIAASLRGSDPREALAKSLGKAVIPNAWPRLKEGDLCLVLGSEGLAYLMVVHQPQGKKVVLRSLGEAQL